MASKAISDDIPIYCDHTRLVESASLKPNPRNPNPVELDPAYVAIALERWHNLTGREPELVK